MTPLKTKVTKIYNLLLRLAIIVATYYFIYRQLFRHQQLDDLFSELGSLAGSGAGAGLMLVILLLMPVNWGLETAKWKMMIARIEKLGWMQSFKAVFTGISVSFFTPNRTGEYLGRVFILTSANRIEGILITVAGSISQMAVTLALGLCGLAFALWSGAGMAGNDRTLYPLLLAITPLLLLMLLLAYFNLGATARLLKNMLPQRWSRFTDRLAVLEGFSRTVLVRVLLLSLARYLVFSAQFFLLLRLFSVPVPYFDALMLIAVIYLVMLIAPSIALLEVGIRGSVSLFVFQAYLGNPGSNMGIFFASVLIWLINLVIPALLGTFFVHKLHFFRR